MKWKKHRFDNPKQKKNRCTGNPSGFIGSGKGTLLMADWQIRKFVDEKSDWLYAHLREMEQKQKLEAARPKAAPLNPGELQMLADEARA